MSDTDPYLIPGTSVLRNKFSITDPDQLEYVERRITTERGSQNVPAGKFDLTHLKRIHRHLFQDIYDWAGQLRTLEISKGGNQFQLRSYIETGMADVHRRLVKTKFLRGLSVEDFAMAAGTIMGDVNYVHPFREGNGRTQLLYLQQLAEQAGHRLDLTRFMPQGWLDASRAAHDSDYDLMAMEILKACR